MIVCTASPNTKLGLRMTTLHEEQTHSSLCHEEVEEEASEGEGENNPSRTEPLRFAEIDSVRALL